jgi:asparagine synthetase B (glutamine-hydrolysing)
MRVVTDYELARTLAVRREPVLYSHFRGNMHERTEHHGHEKHVIGRRYRGLFDDNDGSYLTVTKAASGVGTVIDRDCYGAIPLFYSTRRPLVSTDMRLIVEIDGSSFSSQALAEYLSAAYLTGGKTIYENVRSLMPSEMLAWDGTSLKTKAKRIFPQDEVRNEREASRLLEAALDNSIDDLIARYPNKILLNLSGGTDSTLILAKTRAKDPRKEVVTTTYFHDDWRDDLNDWKYAERASETFGSRHTLVKVNNTTVCREHRDLLNRAQNVFHTYAPAFYAQNKGSDTFGDDVPIVNGTGPDESIIGTEKVAIGDLLSLRTLERDRWIEYLIVEIDYIKIPEGTAVQMLRQAGEGFVQTRRAIAAELLDAADFVEFQRRYHALTILQDHVQELSTVAGVLERPIIFPYLTNDIFRIVFSTRFDVLNARATYKSILKCLLEQVMPKEFVHRRKIGFQSPSRPYFQSDAGLGRELSRLLSKGTSPLLDLGRVVPQVRRRLGADLDLRGRYDFLEWTAYNILLLEECRAVHA